MEKIGLEVFAPCATVGTNITTFILYLQSLVSCLGGAFLGGVIARMSKDYRHCRAGLPDLVVWNTSNNSYKVRPHHILVL